MTNAIDHGIVCAAADERTLVRHVNAFLASRDFRPLYKQTPTHIQPTGRTFRIAHVYRQFLKEHPRWYFDLTPNVDLDGRARFADDLDCGWTLYANKPSPEHNSSDDEKALDAFFTALAAGTGFPTRVLHQYHGRLDDRL